ncbi:MAG TPA: pitrilysin family protein [Blastocatellia bacterium]|nr:pitrilysin family protein [Blastocatellia bacterium]
MTSHVRKLLAVLFLIVLLTLAASTAGAQSEIDIPYQKFVLKNGLTLIVHEDHKAPIVAVNVWYHVGSKNEKPGRTGFAHLFEHLMFNGSENFNHDYFEPFERIGATDQNGTTNEDRTNYFENVPSAALDVALWMESDRMGHLLGVIDKARLDEQRGVVQNEKRQGENEPYGKVFSVATPNLYPAGHPYSWEVIGSMEDLNAASLEDVREWFRSYYGAANAVIVIAGDVDAKTAKEKVEKYFGDIPSGPPVTKHNVWIAKRTGEHRQQMEDRVPQARIYRFWNVPERGSADADYLTLIGQVLSSGKSSRLYKRLVYDDQIATDVEASPYLMEIGAVFYIQASARPGESLAKVEKAVDEEMARLLAEGPTAAELQRVKTQYRAGFIRGIERIGGFGGKSDVLAMNQVYAGTPDYYKTTLKRMANATTADLKAAANRWLSDGVYALEVHPFPEYAAEQTTVDRTKLPEPGPPADAKFPELQRATLANGLKIVLAERHSIPQVNFQMLIDAGYAADQFNLAGTGGMTFGLLDGGTKRRTALQISDELMMLGANLNAGSDLDTSSVSISALKENLDASLDLFADVVLNPSFPQEDFARLQKQRLAQIQQEKVQPVGIALRVFAGLLYGAGHAYSNPLTGTGTEESVSKLKREDLTKFHQTWFKPNNATLIVVGDTTMAEIKPKLEKLFAAWQRGEVPSKNIGAVASQPKSVVYMVDRPGSEQSLILAANIAPPKANKDESAIETMNALLGGNFTSRINMNLREDKHWSYGAGCFVLDARGQRPFIAYAPVQTDKTKESIAELVKELNGIMGSRPVTGDELAKAQASLTLTLPGSWETMTALSSSIANIVRFGLDDRYYDSYAGKIRALKIPDVMPAAKVTIQPDKLVWVIVGDRAKIEAGVRELGLGEIRLIDADGKPVKQ